MTIASALENLNADITNARTAITTKGGTVTVNGGSSQLATDIATIPTGGGSATLITKSITANGTYNASSDNADGYSSVNVNVPTGITPAGTRTITANGTYDVTNYASADVNVSGGASSKYGATVDSLLGDVDANGVLQFPTGQADLVFDGVTEVISFGMQYKFYRCYGINSVSFPNLTRVYHSGTTEGWEFSYAFTDCKLTSINFPVLSYIGSNRAFHNAFGGTTLTSATFPALANVSGTNSFSLTFSSCSKLKSLYFPAFLGTSSSYASFNNMLSGTHDCVVHFPSNAQSVIGSWSSVTSGFGGTNTTVLFDLPATT